MSDCVDWIYILYQFGKWELWKRGNGHFQAVFPPFSHSFPHCKLEIPHGFTVVPLYIHRERITEGINEKIRTNDSICLTSPLKTYIIKSTAQTKF